jgi:hypothetical protein
MLLVPTDAPRYLDVIKAARLGALDLPPELAHLFLVLAVDYPEIKPRVEDLQALLGYKDKGTVERNLATLKRRGRLTSKVVRRGIQNGGTSYRFLVLPTLPREPHGFPVLAGRGPASWVPELLRVADHYLPRVHA